MLLAVDPDLTWFEAFVRIGAAAGLGGLVGLERELDEKAAGLRTHMLVAVGSALFTMVGAYGFEDFPATSVDPTRDRRAGRDRHRLPRRRPDLPPGLHDPRADHRRQPLARRRDRDVRRRRLLEGRGDRDRRRADQPAPARVDEGARAAAARRAQPGGGARRGRRRPAPVLEAVERARRPARAPARRPPPRDRGPDRPRRRAAARSTRSPRSTRSRRHAGNADPLLAGTSTSWTSCARRSPDWTVELLDADDYPPEDGDTYYDNARGKALYGRAVGPADAWVLGEDSGIEVDALGGEPGVAFGALGGERPAAPPSAGTARRRDRPRTRG